MRSGAAGEREACSYLERQGYTILGRNFRIRHGEIDIIARRDGVTVFVEVKQRVGRSHGEGHEAVGPEKRRRIVQAARVWAAQRGLSDAASRFDVISIARSGDGRPLIRHDQGAFDADGE